MAHEKLAVQLDGSHPAEAQSDRPEGEQLPHRSVFLHHQSVESSGVLIGEEQARQEYAVNGDILAVLELPPKTAGAKPRRVGVVDFGEEAVADKKPVFVVSMEEVGQPMTYGKAASRYGLVGLNYIPDDHLAPYAPITEEKPVVLGRTAFNKAAPFSINHILGLSQPPDQPSYLSRDHATVTVGPESGVYVADHSTHGTTVEIPALEAATSTE